MIRKRERRGFTLVELLVVISIIGMLVAMLLPAVQAAREAGRRADCMSKQRNWGLALHQYDSRVGRFPGFFGQIGKDKTTPAPQNPYYWGSWMVSLFPHIEKNDLWEMWSTGRAAYAVVNLDLTHCPSSPIDDSAGQTSFSYQVNSGRVGICSYTVSGTPVEDITACGIFDVNVPVDADTTTPWTAFSKRRSGSLSTIRDGATHTLMLSENTQEANWAVYPQAADLGSQDAFWMFLRNTAERWLCFRIPDTQDLTNYPTGMEYINQKFDDPTRLERPASYHPGGVVVTFCDNHQLFMSDQVEVPVFLHLMTSNSRRAAEQGYYASPQWYYYPLMLRDPTDVSQGMTVLDDAEY